MLLVSNISLPKRWTAANGKTGESIRVETADQFIRASGKDTVWVVNCDPGLTFQLAAWKWRRIFETQRLVVIDIVLRRPNRLVSRPAVLVKRLLLRKVDHFVHYFRDLRGYAEVYGIDEARSSFVPFKPNLRHGQEQFPVVEGEYVLCFGRSCRDFDTFFQAMETLPYPGAISDPDREKLKAHGARFTRSLEQLPTNVRVLPDEGGEQAQIRILQGARLVVLPIVSTSIVASGISTALNAMLLRKCVIGTEGPGMGDVFGKAVLTVPPEDPISLAAVIRKAWEEQDVRAAAAAAGQTYALALGGKDDLYQRIVDQVAVAKYQ